MSKPNWPVLALIFVSTCAVMVVIARMGWLKGGPLPAICYDLYWPEGSNRRDWALGHNNKGTRRIPESSPVLGNADGARQSVYAEAWKAAPGLDEATLWPSVVFQVSAATINREPVWIIRATSGQWIGSLDIWRVRQSRVGRHFCWSSRRQQYNAL